MEMQLEKITPEIAQRYLKRNVSNYRKISKSKVAQYAQEMKAGRWQTNGESIAFDESGRLKNGQHRLAAIMMAGIPVEMVVVRGVDNDVNIYDVGSCRSLAQIAQANGAAEITNTECAVGNIIVGSWARISKGMALPYITQHAEELKRAFRCCGGGNKSNLSRRASAVLATYMMLRQGIPYYELEVFFKAFNSGNTVGMDGYEPSPALVARRMFMDRYKAKAADMKSNKEQTEILIMAIRDFHKAKSRQVNYKLQEPFYCVGLLEKIRKEDGLV